jgi:hypothetical protein
MVGADYITPLVRSAGTGPTPSAFTVSLSPSVGVAKPTEGDGTFAAASVGLPVAVAMGGDAGARVAAFVSPGLGFGMISGSGESESGVRPMLGGGVGLRFSNLTISGSAQKIFIDVGEIQFGVGIAVGQ